MRALRVAVIGLTLAVMALESLPYVPRAWLDYGGLPLLSGIEQPATWGTDTTADRYAARVVRHDLRDMYTKRTVDQTPEEAAAWTKEESAPYPPVALLVIAGLSIAGDAIGIGYYGMVLAAALLFLGLSLRYFLQTRWYLFPILYLNFGYFAERFVHVQDGTYLVMLNVVMAALLAARAGRPMVHTLMALATTLKLLPIFHLKYLLVMGVRHAAVFLAVLAAGLVLPYFVWENYLYIYQFGYGLRGDTSGAAGALIAAALLALLIAYVDGKGRFDAEERIGWALVPAAVFLALKLNAPRHLLLALLVPDKRGLRNVAAAGGLLLHTLAPSVIRFGSIGPIVSGLLFIALVWHLHRIGWRDIWADLRQPGKTLGAMANPR